MTWEEAKKVMNAGHKVRNKYFTKDEYFEMIDTRIVCERGYDMSSWYRNEDWQNEGWLIL